MEYVVSLGGADRDIRFLAGLCSAQNQVQVVRHSQTGFMLRAPGLLELSAPLDAARLSERLISSLNGLARTQDPDFRPVSKRGLFRVEEDGVSLTEIPQIAILDVRPPELRPQPYADLARLITTSVADARVLRVLKLLSVSEDRWFALYWIYELVLEDLGSTRNDRELRAVALGWASQQDLSGFRATANWHETENGRHATPQRPNQKAPPKLMHELYAQHMMGELVIKWLRYRCATMSWKE